MAFDDPLLIRYPVCVRHDCQSATTSQKNGPPLAQGASRGVETPSGSQQGAGERIPIAALKLWYGRCVVKPFSRSLQDCGLTAELKNVPIIGRPVPYGVH